MDRIPKDYGLCQISTCKKFRTCDRIHRKDPKKQVKCIDYIYIWASLDDLNHQKH